MIMFCLSHTENSAKISGTNSIHNAINIDVVHSFVCLIRKSIQAFLKFLSFSTEEEKELRGKVI